MKTKKTPKEAEWIATARMMLIEGGIAAVQISPLAKRLGVTRGGFYWRFTSRQDLLDHLLVDWEHQNTQPFLDIVSSPGTPHERYQRVVDLWIEEVGFDSKLDTAIRQWGAIDTAIAAVVRRNDDSRIAALQQLFEFAGQQQTEAMVRARIVYFHQIGYYTLGIHETIDQRRHLLPYYDTILTGFAE
jgi:AcrR family transcriptional regulator